LQYGGRAVLGYVGFGITSGPFRDQSLIDIDAVMCVRGASAAQEVYVPSVGALRRYDHIGLFEYTDREGLSSKNLGDDEWSVTVYGKKAFLAFGTNEDDNGTIQTPLIADVAGCMARTDRDQASWFSPAGARRGRILNTLRLVDNPSASEADTLYDNGINVVMTFPGEGTILFGDKTNGASTSSLSRINVARLFIYLKKVVGRAARGILFEQNDTVTRGGFTTSVTSILDNIVAQRGLTDYRIVCDETNNPPAVVDANEFVADVYLKPTKSINYVKLRFTNKNTGDVLDG
jgi:phage tail sheath protein FI